MRRRFVFSLLIALILCLVFCVFNPATVRAATIHHYEYVFTAGFIYVYDMDNGHGLLKTVAVPTTAGVRGAVASVATGMLYISYGSDANSGGFQLAYNLSTDRVVWTMCYPHGIDSQSVSPDGKTIYMPAGEASSSGTWYVEQSSNGIDLAKISSGGSGAHNTIVSPGGNRVYLGNRDLNLSKGAPGVHDFDIGDTATNLIVGSVSPLQSGARPFTINSAETLSFITLTGFLGFQVGDLAAGKVIYTVAVDGSHIPGFTTFTTATTPSHGISLSPDDKELYLIDEANSYVHVFDVSGLPASAPAQVADIKLVNSMAGSEAGCAYDCGKNGWLLHSRDGRFVYVGDSGDVIDTLTRKTIATLPQLANSRQHIEIDFQDSTPIWAATSRSGIGYVNPLPPTFTTRITSPNLGSAVSGTNVTVSASVFDSASIAAVDLYKDGVLYASTTASPYSFSWDTTRDANGPHTLMLTAQDTLGNTTSFSDNLIVNNATPPNPPSITTTTLANGTQNVPYSATLTASGGTPPYAWSIVSGALPAGLSLAPRTGIISGTPTATASSDFTVQVSDANSLTASKALSLTINSNEGGGGIALVQANAIQGSGVASLSAVFAANNTAGNLILAFVRMSSTRQSVKVTDRLGNAYTEAVAQVQAADGHQVHIFYAKNIAGGANTVKATFSAANKHPWLAIYEYSGLSKTAPLDQTARAQGSNAAPSSGTAPMTASANELLFGGMGLPSSYRGTAAAGSGYAMLERSASGSSADNEGEAVTSPGTFAAVFGLSRSTNWSAVLATFKP
jgi:hypothetical protein